MISCTEFIPLYSEFFKYLEARGGHDEVYNYWCYISDTVTADKTNPNSLGYKCERLGGFEGSIAYWGHTLTEEACDLFEINDRGQRFKYSHMRHCPSRGMLNELEHVEPYYDYCEHCKVLYQRVLDNYGIVYERDHSGIERAECRSILYEKGNRPDVDLGNISDEQMIALASKDAEIVDMRSGDHKYLHRDFHTAADSALKYCAEKYGEDDVVSFLRDFTGSYYAPKIKAFKEHGLEAIEEWIRDTYRREEAEDVLHTEISDGVLTVTVDKCPAVEYMRKLGIEPSKYFIEETRTVYATVAEECGYGFTLEYYREDGAARFEFNT
ncbi:MAG: hypothetical protein E7667_07130 [Ruminococcaceae bacterium]|nr:hypothetical protein [Oscillospiraceae bacterium]